MASWNAPVPIISKRLTLCQNGNDENESVDDLNSHDHQYRSPEPFGNEDCTVETKDRESNGRHGRTPENRCYVVNLPL